MKHSTLPFLALALTLSGCGGGGGSGGTAVVSTPPPTATYTKLANLTGDQSFQTAGVQYAVGTGINYTQAKMLPLGSGVQLNYTASSNTYTLTDTSGDSSTFTATDQVSNPPANSAQWQKTSANLVERLTLSTPVVNGVPLSYTVAASWLRLDPNTLVGTERVTLGGAPTQTGDMPVSGSATYTTGVDGKLDQPSINTGYTLKQNSTATFSANFANNTVATTLNLSGVSITSPNSAAVALGTYTGTGTISGNKITGTVGNSTTTGAFTGLFLGPQAAEFGAGWNLSGTINGVQSNAAGIVYGMKQ